MDLRFLWTCPRLFLSGFHGELCYPDPGKGRRWRKRLKGVKRKIDFSIESVVALITECLKMAKLPPSVSTAATQNSFSFLFSS